MISRLQIFCLYLFLVFFTISCNSGNNKGGTDKVRIISRDTVESYNREAARNEDREIDDFLARYHWNMIKTSTGLRYMIYRNGEGKKAETGQTATLKYTLKLLNGDVVYSSDKDGLKKFRIGQGGVESGLEEGILYLHEGDKVKFIVPSHLAYGLLGDQNLIPPGATLVYDIELLKLN